VDHFAAQGRKTTRLRVSHAFHSPLMDPMLDDFRKIAESLNYEAPATPIVSTLTGKAVTAEQIGTAEYWVRHAREAVRFADAVEALHAEGVLRFLEVGPDGVLSALVRSTVDEATAVPALRAGQDEPTALLTAIGHLHADGADVDWRAVFAGRGGRRVELPTYAFQRKRYWTEPAASVRAPAQAPADGVDSAFWDAVEREDLPALAEGLDLEASALGDVLPALSSWRRRHLERSAADSWRYRIVWKPIPDRTESALPGTWLVAVPEGHGDREPVTSILEGLAAQGARVVPMDVAGDEDRAALSLRLAGHEDADGVLSLLAFDDRVHPRHPTLTLGTAGTITLAQALGDAGSGARLWCVTSGAVAVDRSAELTDPAQASLWGLGTVLGLENPATWGGMVDLPAVVDGRAVRRLCGVLSGADGDQLAIRPAKVAARRMVRASAAAPDGTMNGTTTWRPRGTVLVTGGTGGIGAHVARWLARGGAGHIVLTSRRGPSAEGAAELEAELAALGARVTIAACDVADRDAVRELLDALDAPAAPAGNDHPLTAVVHAAGVLGDGKALADLPVEEFAEIGRAKIAGARHLDELLGDRPLDAFVLFSSGAAAWGGAGQSAYGAANAYLDALAHRRRARGLTATAVAWGAWDAGMVDTEVGAASRRLGLAAMEPGAAIGVLQRALDHDESHLVVADIDWTRFAAAYTLTRRRPLLDDLPEVRQALDGDAEAAPSGADDQAARLAAMSEAERGRALRDLVRAHVAAVLGHDDAAALEPGRAFTDLGLDSVAAVELRSRLSAATGRRLPATLAFDHASPAALAAHLTDLLRPDGGAGGDAPGDRPIGAELDRLEEALAALPAEEAERGRLAARLQSMAARLTEPAGARDAAAVADRLEHASADDIFDFIDKDLGMA
ncbi:SDR family NAD(P)-dependent oxidoreductase, partial [Actinomadura sp. KC06]|uniref:SDR family NAD(P)-dependent oxidoreductase n=1 Tax=Actinomadura sp. KC06 TaxID=2530369 RepID=UPI00104CD5BC